MTSDGGDTLALRWESEELRAVGAAMYTFVRDQAVSQGISVAGTAVIGAAFSAMTLPLAVLQSTDMIDSAWEVASRRADRAGKQLALVLVERVHGYRPVTLVGFGLGARLIMQCLLELESMGAKGKGIVETAALLGTPFGVEPDLWTKASEVVGHRLINGYIEKDWMLSLIYRSSSFKRKIAGLSPVEVAASTRAARVLENINLSALIGGHWAYREQLSRVIHILGLASGIPLPPPPAEDEAAVVERPRDTSAPAHKGCFTWLAGRSSSCAASSDDGESLCQEVGADVDDEARPLLLDGPDVRDASVSSPPEEAAAAPPGSPGLTGYRGMREGLEEGLAPCPAMRLCAVLGEEHMPVASSPLASGQNTSERTNLERAGSGENDERVIARHLDALICSLPPSPGESCSLSMAYTLALLAVLVRVAAIARAV